MLGLYKSGPSFSYLQISIIFTTLKILTGHPWNINMAFKTLSNGEKCYYEASEGVGFCFLVGGSPTKSWMAAAFTCKNHGGQLLGKPGGSTTIVVNKAMSLEGVTEAWVGMTKINIPWTWTDRTIQSSAGLGFWASGEPSDIDTGSDCILINVTNGYKMSTQPCHKKAGYICETDVQSTLCQARGSEFTEVIIVHNKCYLFMDSSRDPTQNVSWFSAKKSCSTFSKEASLAKMVDDEVYKAMVNAKPGLSHDINGYWIGLTRAKWVEASELSIDILLVGGLPATSCVSMVTTSTVTPSLAAHDCYELLHYICEINIGVIQGESSHDPGYTTAQSNTRSPTVTLSNHMTTVITPDVQATATTGVQDTQYSNITTDSNTHIISTMTTDTPNNTTTTNTPNNTTTTYTPNNITTTYTPNNTTTTYTPNNITTTNVPHNITATNTPNNITTTDMPHITTTNAQHNMTTTDTPHNSTTTDTPHNITTNTPHNITTTDMPHNSTTTDTPHNITTTDTSHDNTRTTNSSASSLSSSLPPSVQTMSSAKTMFQSPTITKPPVTSKPSCTRTFRITFVVTITIEMDGDTNKVRLFINNVTQIIADKSMSSCFNISVSSLSDNTTITANVTDHSTPTPSNTASVDSRDDPKEVCVIVSTCDSASLSRLSSITMNPDISWVLVCIGASNGLADPQNTGILSKFTSIIQSDDVSNLDGITTNLTDVLWTYYNISNTSYIHPINTTSKTLTNTWETASSTSDSTVSDFWDLVTTDPTDNYTTTSAISESLMSQTFIIIVVVVPFTLLLLLAVVIILVASRHRMKLAKKSPSLGGESHDQILVKRTGSNKFSRIREGNSSARDQFRSRTDNINRSKRGIIKLKPPRPGQSKTDNAPNQLFYNCWTVPVKHSKN